MKITEQEYKIIKGALYNAFNYIHLNVVNDFEVYCENEEMRVAVNWACFGDTNAEEAKTFAHELLTASSVAEGLNQMDITVDMSAEDTITSKEQYFELKQKVLESIHGGSLIWIRRIGLTNGLN